jgi:hypothetical protein
MIERQPWYCRVKPNLPAKTPIKLYVEAWLALLVARWDQSQQEGGRSNVR